MSNSLLCTQQIVEVIQVCLLEPGLKGRRDAALFALVWCGQLSIPEAVRLTAGEAQRIVHACGGPFRQAIDEWIHLRAEADGPFLLTINRRGRIEAKAMPATTAAEIVRRRAAEAKAGYVTPQELLRASVLASRRVHTQLDSSSACGQAG